jgi:hypothetical protein
MRARPEIDPKVAATLSLMLTLAACATVTTTPGPQPGPRPPAPEARVGDPRIIPSAQPLQCVPYARGRSGIQIYGNADTWWTQAAGRYERARTPRVGSVVALRAHDGAQRGHVAVVTAVVDARVVLVAQANWLNQGEVSLDVPLRDVSPEGDWSAARMWHIPSAAWGARVYPVEGFILPN